MPQNPNRNRARNLRNNPTDAEYRLWGHLRSQQLRGVKFRRQATIGPYIVDFVAHEPKLIVELDGTQHATQLDYDERRTQWLQSQGFRVLRFWNQEFWDHPETVLEQIARTLEELTAPRKPPLNP